MADLDYQALATTERDLLILILQRQDTIMAQIADIKAELETTKTELATALAAIKSVLDTTATQQAQIDGLTKQVSDLKAGDVLTQQQIDDLATTADAVKTGADSVLAAVQPPSPT